MSIMLELNHPHIIKLLDFFEKKDSYYMVVEKANGQFNVAIVVYWIISNRSPLALWGGGRGGASLMCHPSRFVQEENCSIV